MQHCGCCFFKKNHSGIKKYCNRLVQTVRRFKRKIHISQYINTGKQINNTIQSAKKTSLGKHTHKHNCNMFYFKYFQDCLLYSFLSICAVLVPCITVMSQRWLNQKEVLDICISGEKLKQESQFAGLLPSMKLLKIVYNIEQSNNLFCIFFSIPDFIHYIFFPILILQEEPVFPFLMCGAKQQNYLVPFL